MDKINKTDELGIILKKRFTVDVFQREYRWGRKQIEQMISDFQSTFGEFYDPKMHGTTEEVETYGYYYMGCIICTGGSPQKIIDGQQRLTSLTLLLIFLNNLQEEQKENGIQAVKFEDLIYGDHYGRKCFNIDVDERQLCLEALLTNNTTYLPDNESARNMMDRYKDIVELFPDELKGEALPYFIYWLKDKVLLLEIDTPSEDEAHTIFLTMNDRGLSLNSAEMMKAYVMQQIAESDRFAVNHQWQKNINSIKNTSPYDTSGVVYTEDVEFISTWLRAKYADTLREGKRGAKDEDFELLGEKFHTWVRGNAKTKMGLVKSNDYKDFVLTEMTRVTNLYLKLKEYGSKLTAGYEEVFYNANRDLNYQTLLIISAVCNDDPDDIVRRKIQMVSKFVDDFASIRIFNTRKVNWNTNKYLLFKVMRDIRNKDCRTVGMTLVKTLRRLDVSIDAITRFNLKQFTGRYMLHILARFTSFVNVKMGNPSQFDIYVDRTREGNTYDIEHILPNDYDSYQDDFASPEEFQEYRDKIGNLIILTRDKNRSYQAMKYSEKVTKYIGDNVLAQALNSIAYQNNPQFLAVATQYGFSAIPKFTKDSIADRANIYLQMAIDIWDPNLIKEIAGGWEDEVEKEFFKNDKAQEYTVEYYGRSWEDAVKYGFLSANIGGSGKLLKNIKEGDIVYCHIANYGFVGIGICTASSVAMTRFTVSIDGKDVPISEVEWVNPLHKSKLDPDGEIFIRVDWKSYVEDLNDGYWEKGMTSIPLVAYKLNDQTTYQKVRQRFGYRE